ncbi:S-layer protein [Anabaena azotica]|uniref:S-layer protein n=1 Tax=Anabaena azotica FACHB-119 TaxID=947527 RepID=A0ABR8CZI2_9NOST|nr:S-layer protein [Anabaena azotica]MBD2500252.1 S-layer protein [Anabaena azotica FACHB-119]
MKHQTLATAIVIAITGIFTGVNAQERTNQEPEKSTPVIEACIQNRAETLPNPFSDVPENHWAFKAVMTMHYCGAFRQATPPKLFPKLKPTEGQQQSKPEN